MANTDDVDWDHFKEVFDPFLNGNYETIENFINQIPDINAQGLRIYYLNVWKKLRIQLLLLFSTEKEHVFARANWKNFLTGLEVDYKTSEQGLKDLSLGLASAFLGKVESDIISFLSSLNAPSTPFIGGI